MDAGIFLIVYLVVFGTFGLIGHQLTHSLTGGWTGFLFGPLGILVIFHVLLTKEISSDKKLKLKPVPNYG